MSVFLDTTGEATLGIGICARCSRKMPLGDLSPDPNAPGLYVCEDDKDVLDPWRLPPRQPEDLTLPFYRPDTPLAVNNSTSPTATLIKLGDRFYWNIDGPVPEV